MTDSAPRPVGINHVALVVGDVEAAVEFYQSLFEFELRGRTDGGAFLDIGDQFIALMAGEPGEADTERHFGLVVDDADALRDRLDAEGVDTLDTGGLDFRDPWGNRVQVVEYREVQFSKAEHVLRGMGFDGEKTEAALEELAEKGMVPE